MIIRRVSGISMLPGFKPGNIVIGVKSRNIKPGQVVIFDHLGLEKIKRVNKVLKQGIHVEGDNKKSSTDSRHFGLISRDIRLHKIIFKL